MPQPIRTPQRWIAALALTTAIAPWTAHAQQAVPAHFGFVEVYAFGGKDQPAVLRRVAAIGDEGEWASRADYPADAVAAKEDGSVTTRVSVDATDAITGCVIQEGNASERLRQLACKLVRERGRFRHALSVAGEPVAGETNVLFMFTVRDVDQRPINPPAPPAPSPGGYPYTPGLSVMKLADWKDFAPPGKPSGDVVVSLSIYPPFGQGPERRNCYITDSSGDEALDKATCEAVKAGHFAVLGGQYGSSGIKMLVHWKKGKARYELPSRARGTPLAITGGDAAVRPVLAAGAVTERGWASAMFHADGRVTCRIAVSTGSDETDRAICAYIGTKVTFTPETDLFGRNVDASRYFRFDP